jgi:hypothetical protein
VSWSTADHPTVRSTSVTVDPLVGVVMAQLVLSGALFEIAGRAVLEQIAWLSPSRWAYAAAASAMDLDRVSGDDWIAGAGGGHYLLATTMMGFLAMVVLGLGLWLVHRSAGRE